MQPIYNPDSTFKCSNNTFVKMEPEDFLEPNEGQHDNNSVSGSILKSLLENDKKGYEAIQQRMFFGELLASQDDPEQPECDQQKEEKGEPVCQICDKRLTSLYHLHRHYRVHTGEKPYKCSVCSKCFSHKYVLKRHFSGHVGTKTHFCKICTKSFFTMSDLRAHLRVHTGEKPYRCELCGKAFASSSSLRYHRLHHTGEKPHVCNLCGMAFKRSKNLRDHTLVHTGEQPFACDICGRRFKLKKNLQDHAKTHLKEKPYPCGQCGKAYYSMRSKQKHDLTHKGENSPTVAPVPEIEVDLQNDTLDDTTTDLFFICADKSFVKMKPEQHSQEIENHYQGTNPVLANILKGIIDQAAEMRKAAQIIPPKHMISH